MRKPNALLLLFLLLQSAAVFADEVSAQDARLGELVTVPAGLFLMGNNGNEPFSPDA